MMAEGDRRQKYKKHLPKSSVWCRRHGCNSETFNPVRTVDRKQSCRNFQDKFINLHMNHMKNLRYFADYVIMK